MMMMMVMMMMMMMITMMMMNRKTGNLTVLFLARRLLQLFSLFFFTVEMAELSHQPATTILKECLI